MRYIVAGVRPGMRFWVEGSGIIETNPIDGSAELNEAQRADLDRRGYVLVETDEAPPAVDGDVETDEIAAARAANAAAAAENAAAQARLERELEKPLKKTTQLQENRAAERAGR